MEYLSFYLDLKNKLFLSKFCSFPYADVVYTLLNLYLSISLFDADANGSGNVFSTPGTNFYCWCRGSNVLFILSLNPANVLYILISSMSFFVDCRIFYIGKSCHLQQREIYFFFSNLYAIYLFICFIVLRRTFSAILNKIGKSQHLASFLILAGKCLVSYHLTVSCTFFF